MHPGDGVELSKQAALTLEAEHLHRCLFFREALPPLVVSYLQVNAMMPELHDSPLEQLRTLNIIVSARLDAVSIEPWLRGGRRRHILTSKLLLVAYLAECDGQHASFLRSGAGGYLTLFLAGLQGMVGLLRGRYHKARHGLV